MDFHQQQVQKQTSVMAWACISDFHMCAGSVPWTWRRMLWLYRDIYCAIDDIFPGKQHNAGLIQGVLQQQSGFLDTTHHTVDVLDCPQSRSFSYWKSLAHNEKENQTTMIMDCWAAVLNQARLGKYSICKTATMSILISQMI